MKRLYVVYDQRAITSDPDDAAVLVTCESLREAHSYDGDYGAAAVFSYDASRRELTDERFEYQTDEHGNQI